MSGGAYDYVYSKISDLEHDIRRQDEDPRRAAFAKLMGLVARAMQDIEWVDSCDSSQGSEHAAIDRVFAFLGADHETIKKANAFDRFRHKTLLFFDALPNELVSRE